MSRKFKTGKKNRTNYIYYALDGTKIVLTPGDDGVTAANIALLHELDDSEFNNNRVNESKQLRFEAMHSSEDGEDVSDRLPEIADAKQDILFLLDQAEQHVQLYKAMESLLPQQKDLIEQVHFNGRQIVDIARQQGVSHVAILDRLKRIYQKLGKNF